MPGATRHVTAEELERFPDDDYRYELVEGRLIRMSPVGYQHGQVVVRFASLLDHFVRDGNLGVVLAEVGFKLASNPDTVRGPDVAFIRQDRLPPPDPQRFINGPPDLAVEVVSPDDRASEMCAKVEEYLARGVPLVLVVDPEERTIAAHRRLTPSVINKADEDIIELGDVITGFRCTLREVLD